MKPKFLADFLNMGISGEVLQVFLQNVTAIKMLDTTNQHLVSQTKNL